MTKKTFRNADVRKGFRKCFLISNNIILTPHLVPPDLVVRPPRGIRTRGLRTPGLEASIQLFLTSKLSVVCYLASLTNNPNFD